LAGNPLLGQPHHFCWANTRHLAQLLGTADELFSTVAVGGRH
jgi:hypothetical protein